MIYPIILGNHNLKPSTGFILHLRSAAVSYRFLPFCRVASFTSSMKINSPVVEQQTSNSWREMSTAISVW